jgi:DNA-binding CsgD family transcriptional regulator
MPPRDPTSLVDRLYAAAAGEIALDTALAAVAADAGAALGLLLLQRRGSVRVLAASGLGAALDLELDAGLNRLLADGLAGSRGAAVELDAADWRPPPDAAGSEAGGISGCRHLLLMPLAVDTPRRAVLLLARRAGPFTPMQREQCVSLRTHWLRALQLLGCLHDGPATGGLLARTLDALPCPVLLLDDERCVRQANRAARIRLQAGDVVTELRGRLVIGGAERETFETDWAAMCTDPAATGRTFALRRNGESAGLILDATALDDAGERIWLMRLAETTASRPRLAAGWRLQFGLTASECRVGLALLEHGDAMSVAAALGVAGNTARSHLKTMFAKTGTHSQAALALRLVQPLRLTD